MLRRLDEVPWWSYGLARHLFAREARALDRARDLDIGPQLLWAGRQRAGAQLHRRRARCIWQSRMATLAYFRSAKQALRRLHRAGICHNDLAKEQNWLRGRDGRAYLTDFQLAACFCEARAGCSASRLTKTSGIMLKHKRSYAPEALTPTRSARSWRARSFVARHLAGDRQEGLSGHHPRPVQFHRPRRRRPAAGQRRAGADRADPQEPGRARHGHRGLRRPPQRRRPLRLCRGRSDRAGKAAAAANLPRPKGSSRRSISRWCTPCRAMPPASRAPKSCNSSR